ncbi:hypothetical protein GCM10010238_49140 [Streptomyces griseoviridis]|uniref:Uncharacterized protein n=1 Tax=Streptomyces griseoviridis TaxID=45398 RepID=A0A918GS55_STRGD|nr:hypothetical protein GCM10010238_49140 [Streptomyces niveoruber]
MSSGRVGDAAGRSVAAGAGAGSVVGCTCPASRKTPGADARSWQVSRQVFLVQAKALSVRSRSTMKPCRANQAAARRGNAAQVAAFSPGGSSVWARGVWSSRAVCGQAATNGARPGEPVHLAVKKPGRVPDGGGHKVLGRAAGSPDNDRRNGAGHGAGEGCGGAVEAAMPHRAAGLTGPIRCSRRSRSRSRRTR